MNMMINIGKTFKITSNQHIFYTVDDHEVCEGELVDNKEPHRLRNISYIEEESKETEIYPDCLKIINKRQKSIIKDIHYKEVFINDLTPKLSLLSLFKNKTTQIKKYQVSKIHKELLTYYEVGVLIGEKIIYFNVMNHPLKIKKSNILSKLK